MAAEAPGPPAPSSAPAQPGAGREPAAPSSAPAELEADRRSAVFFDLDKTLMQGSSAFQFGRAAYRAGLMSRRQLAADAWANLRFRLEGATDEHSLALRNRISASLAGVRVRDLQRLGPDVLGRILPRIYPEMLAVAYEHQDAGRRVYIVTAASAELAEMLASVLAFDGGIGSKFSAVRDGVFTGEAEGEFVYRAGKARAIRALAEREGIELDRSYAYSDSESDLPMLRAVGHPVVVNPDAELLRIARAEGWQTMRLDPLGRRLKALAVVTGAAAAATLGGALRAKSRRARARLRPASRRIRPRRGPETRGRQWASSRGQRSRQWR